MGWPGTLPGFCRCVGSIGVSTFLSFSFESLCNCPIPQNSIDDLRPHFISILRIISGVHHIYTPARLDMLAQVTCGPGVFRVKKPLNLDTTMIPVAGESMCTAPIPMNHLDFKKRINR